MAGISRAYKRRGNMVANTGGPVMCLDAGSKISYPGTGTTWTDLSGNANTGTLVNGPTFNSANSGSIVFDGVNDYASTPYSLSGASAFSCSAWIKTTTVNKEIMATYGLGNIFEFWISAGGTVSVYAYGSTLGYRDSVLSVITGNWAYCTGVYNGSGSSLDMYSNGLLNNGTLTDTIPSTLNAALQNVVIGNLNSGSYFFNGSMGQATIYNRALSAAEISTNFELTRGRYGI